MPIPTGMSRDQLLESKSEYIEAKGRRDVYEKGHVRGTVEQDSTSSKNKRQWTGATRSNSVKERTKTRVNQFK